VGGSQASPIYKIEMEFSSRGLDVACEDIVVPHRPAFNQRLENEIIRPICFHNPIPPCARTSPDFDGETLQPMNSADDREIYRDCRIAGFALWRSPIAPATAFVDRDGILMNVAPA
jgi:hypothetical protein